MRRWLGSMTGVAALLLVTACGTPGIDPPTSADPSSTSQPADPVDLVGLWRVSEAADEGADTWLRLDARELVLWRDCGYLSGAWHADSVAFLATISASSGACADAGEMATADWLTSAWSYEATDIGWQLLDREGSPVAELTQDGAPEPVDNAPQEWTQPPEITDETRAAFEDPAPLPDDREPVTEDALIGRWEPVTDHPTDPFLEFGADGSWSGSDGCNGLGGGWRLDGDLLIATAGPQTAIGCAGEDLTVMGRLRASVESHRLTVYDITGEVQFIVQRS